MFDEYPKQTDQEKYSGLWGRFGFLLQFRDAEALVKEVNSKDSVYRAAGYMRLRKEGLDVSQISEIEMEGWKTAMKLATTHTIKGFVKNETDLDLALEIRDIVLGRDEIDQEQSINGCKSCAHNAKRHKFY